MNGTERLMYLFMSINESFKLLVNMYHKDNDIIIDYLRRMKQAKDILEVHVGKEILGNYVENLE